MKCIGPCWHNWMTEKHMPPEMLIAAERPIDSVASRRLPVHAVVSDRGCRWKSAELEWLVEAYSLDCFAAVAELARLDEVADEANYLVRRHELATGDAQRQAISIQIERRPRFRDRWRNLRAGHLPFGRLKHEFELSRQLIQSGFAVPEPLVYGDRSWRGQGAWLVLAEPPQAVGLPEYFDDPTGCHPAERLRQFLGLGGEIARLHNAGFSHGRLHAANVLVVNDGSRTQFAFRSLGRGARQRQVAIDRRAFDLASLLATLSSKTATRGERRALLQAYLERARFDGDEQDFRERISDQTRRLLERRETWETREGSAHRRAATTQLEAVEKGQLWCEAAARPALATARLLAFDAVLATTNGRLLRALDDRENWRLELSDSSGSCRAYLKKHHIRTWQTRLRALWGARPSATAGRTEATNIARLNRAGIPSMRLMAFGEKLHRDGRLESFVLTEELAGFMQLDHFLRFRFPAHEASAGHGDTDLGLLIRKVAQCASQFHRLGYNHRDLYCCHFFIREGSCGGFQVNLIDLQRVQHRRRFRRRWIVKDLAQLAYSAPRERIGCRERVAFLHAYFGVRKLRAEHKRLIGRVVLKQRWMERTLGLHP